MDNNKDSKDKSTKSKNKKSLKEESLIPIKGINVERTRYLNELGIETISDLLSKGRTIDQRKEIAINLMTLELEMEKNNKNYDTWEKKYIKYVDLWVKQADLWRVNEMDEDTAYFLVELGVRHIDDLTKVDPYKAYDMMKCLHNSQPEFDLISIDTLKKLILNAKDIPSKYPEYQDILTSKITGSLEKVKIDFYELEKLLDLLKEINIEDIIGGNSIECDDPAPTFLFRDNFNAELILDKNNNTKDIAKALGFLQDVELALPLPRVIKGKVYMVKSGESLPEVGNNREDYVLYDGLVEVSGISSSSEDKAEDGSNPHGYTDIKGNFLIIMPDKYNMQETITIIISKGIYKQKVVLSASDLISHVDKQKILKSFNELDFLCKDLETEERKLNFASLKLQEEEKNLNDINMSMEEIKTFETEEFDPTKDNFNQNEYIENPVSNNGVRYHHLNLQKQSTEDRINNLKEEIKRLENEIQLLETKKDSLEVIIRDSDDTTNDLERIWRNLTLCEHLVSDFTKEPFILNEDILKGYRTDQKRVLPSVKLMGNDNKSIYLPTDTAPSRVFNYSMLQRLVEPSIFPYADPDNGNPRISLTQSVDVMEFKDIIQTTPKNWPQMSSLGIGYILNMYQSWIPDGFTLGNLLYSLILAPGEEQRLVVREKSQSYAITDKAEGAESTAESYETAQIDNTTAAYEYGLQQLLEADSSYKYSAKTSSFGLSAGASYGGAMLGLSGGFSKSSGRASSAASQSNTHNEASNAAQNFQHGIKTASEKVSQAQRLSISMATSNESDSVATRIIANHNHSHTMTIQYWEVMRRYRMETCIDGIDLVLFVPLKLINFLNGSTFTLDSSTFNKEVFNRRYDTILKNSDTLKAALPYKYRPGLNLITRYAAYPKWIFENTESSERKIKLTFKGMFLSFDDLKITMYLKNGKGSIAGDLEYERFTFNKPYETTSAVKDAIKEKRNQTDNLKECKCEFILPGNVTDDDLSSIKIEHSLEEMNYVLFENPDAQGIDRENSAAHNRARLHEEIWNLAKDKTNDEGDIKKIDYFIKMLPEAYFEPNITLYPKNLKELGALRISDINIIGSDKNKLTAMNSSNLLSPSISINILNTSPTLRYSQLQQIESTFQHIVSNTMKYSQVLWTTLSSDERALMLEKYTIDMDYSDISKDPHKDNSNENNSSDDITLPLLNCINVKKLLGFYGNCMLFPFTYPQELADRIGKTAGELQDSLYKYHTNHFRVPSTVISLPTEGMIGEAVLGETNVSEEIDLTRFWNWKDSPIDKMTIDSSYLNTNDYLAGKTTKDITGLNLQGALATTPVTAADLVSALVSRPAPSFDNITGLDQLKDILNVSTDSAAKGRESALKASNEMAKMAMEYAQKGANEERQAEVENKETNKNSKESPPKNENTVKNEDENLNEDKVPTKENTPSSGDGDEDEKIQDISKEEDAVLDKDSSMNFALLANILKEVLGKVEEDVTDPLDPSEDNADSKKSQNKVLDTINKICSKYGISLTDDYNI